MLSAAMTLEFLECRVSKELVMRIAVAICSVNLHTHTHTR